MPPSDAPPHGEARSGASLTVDLDALVANWKDLAARTQPARTGAVVKADAYGLGIGPIATALANAGCTTFFVALPAEGIALRALLPDAEIFVFVGVLSTPEAEIMAERRLAPVLNDLGQIERFAAFARVRDRRFPCAVHIDTGMNRLGLSPAEFVTLATEPERLAPLDVALVMSHLACAHEPDHPMNERQLAAFSSAKRHIGTGARLSLANSAGIFLGKSYHFDLVRPGAALYGLAPLMESPNPMRNVVRLTAPIVQVRDVDSPGTVGYGATHRVAERSKIVTISAGYADGYGFSLSNRGHAFLGAARLPVVGRVSMDLITLDATDAPADALRPGAEIELIGPHISADDVARDAGVIGYEVLTRLGARLRRRYIGAAAKGAL
ncbi:MAG TPA: alanine racemase [Alphaproteobacteria bacterium]|nr:alanine racemase [Alphaproteobacteria bacterium]